MNKIIKKSPITLTSLIFFIVFFSNLMLHLLPNSCDVNNQISCNLYNIMRDTARISEKIFSYSDPNDIAIKLVHKDNPYTNTNVPIDTKIGFSDSVHVIVKRANGVVEYIQ